MEFILKSSSPDQTKELGRRIGSYLQGGEVIALIGDLGAGKTALAQGVGEALGVKGPMTSPTFTLVHEYEGCKDGKSICLIHMDLYRLQHPEEAEVIGVTDAFQRDAVCLIEWPQIAEELLPDDRLEIEIQGSGEMERTIVLRTEASGWDKILSELGSGNWRNQ